MQKRLNSVTGAAAEREMNNNEGTGNEIWNGGGGGEGGGGRHLKHRSNALCTTLGEK